MCVLGYRAVKSSDRHCKNVNLIFLIMKTKNYFLLLLCLFSFTMVTAQDEICTDFESGSTEGWTNLFSVLSISSPALDGTNYLRVRDDSGASWTYNDTSYPTNFEQHLGSCLCFDYKVFNDATSGAPTLNPKITIYQGANPNSYSLRATFISTISITENSDWVHVCAPIELATGGVMPSNADGAWVMSGGATPADWNTLLGNVSGLSFWVDVAGSGAQSEVIGVDNICIQECDNDEPPSNEGAYCCDDENLVLNGNFEAGDTNFSSSYIQTASTYPGEYDVTNTAVNFGATVTDHSFCEDPISYPSNDMYMVVNGRTQQTSTAIVWEQTINGLEEGERYKFCANFKNMPQCTFDILPVVFMNAGTTSSGAQTINTVTSDPCNWQNVEITFTATGPSQSVRILLDEGGNGDGNDVAIDDIYVGKLTDPNLQITVQHDGTTNQITGSLNTISTTDDNLHGVECEYYWYVAESSGFPVSVVWSTFAYGNGSGSMLPPFASTPGPNWDLTTTFPGYTFADDTLYVIGMYTPECGCYDEGFTYQLTYNGRSGMSEETKQDIIDAILNGLDGDLQDDPQEMQPTTLTLYPNPVGDEFQIKLLGENIEEIEVLDLSGKKVLNKRLSGETTETINAASLPSGIYFVRVKDSNNKIHRTKLIKR